MMNIKEQSPIIKFLVTLSLVLTVANLTFTVAEHIRKAKKSTPKD